VVPPPTISQIGGGTCNQPQQIHSRLLVFVLVNSVIKTDVSKHQDTSQMQGRPDAKNREQIFILNRLSDQVARLSKQNFQQVADSVFRVVMWMGTSPVRTPHVRYCF
jgi:hypothetical protein